MIRPHFWFFVVADCKTSQGETSEVAYKLVMYNSDGAHFSYEQAASMLIFPVLTVLLLMAAIPLTVLLREHISRCVQFRNGLHPSVRNLIISLLLFLGSVIMEAIYLYTYGKDGKGTRILDIMSEMGGWLAQFVVSVELISIAWGWCVDELLSPNTRRKNTQRKMAWMLLTIGVLHVIFILLGRQYDDAHTKYHKGETVWALGLIAMRCLLGIGFFYGIYELHSREDNPYQRDFIAKASRWMQR